MKTLEPETLSYLTHLEFGQQTKNTYINITDRGQTPPPVIHDLVLNSYLTELNLKNVSYDKAMMQIAKSAETEKIVNADIERDRAVTSTQRYLSAFEFSAEPETLSSYKNLNILFSSYKKLQKWNFEEESNGIDNLLADLRSDKYSNDVDVLGMDPFLTRLEVTQNSFKAIFNSRTMEQASKEVFDVKALRSDLKISYEKLVNYVLTMAIATDNAEFNEVLSIINTIRKYYADMVARRKSEAKATPKTTTPIVS